MMSLTFVQLLILGATFVYGKDPLDEDDDRKEGRLREFDDLLKRNIADINRQEPRYMVSIIQKARRLESASRYPMSASYYVNLLQKIDTEGIDVVAEEWMRLEHHIHSGASSGIARAILHKNILEGFIDLAAEDARNALNARDPRITRIEPESQDSWDTRHGEI